MRESYTLRYSLIQLSFGLLGSSIIGFSTMYLLSKGFLTDQVGVFFAIGNISVVLFQTIINRVFSRGRAVNTKKMAILMCLVSIISLALLLLNNKKIMILVLFFIPYFISMSIQTNINAISGIIIKMGYELNLGFSRAFSAIAYALNTYILAIIIDKTSSNAVVVAASLFYMLLLLSFFTVQKLEDYRITSLGNISQALEVKEERLTKIRRKKFIIFLVGYACMFAFHYMKATFLINIIEYVNGGVKDLGLALSIGSISEIPILFLFDFLEERFGANKLLVFSSLIFLIQALILLAAKSVTNIYIISILQGGAFGLLIPSGIQLINSKFSLHDNQKYQSILVSASSIGVLFASLVGGFTIRSFGYSVFVYMAVLMVVIGCISFLVSFTSLIEKTDKY
ncbi:MAG: MFS transporter [Anaerococcus sp.]|nr:MFS transporter [Peptoniphilaceae bacterium]MDY3055725.1 MFS transporter [Anaerococcus sp.]